MILSGPEIRQQVELGIIGIDPIVDEQYQQNGVDLILESAENDAKQFRGLKFYLVGTREILTMPSNLMAFVEIRSTWARRGLLMPPTIVDAGFHGNLTLEVFAAKTMFIPFGQRFAHLIFARCSGPTTPYRGKYFGQSGVTPAIEDKNGA